MSVEFFQTRMGRTLIEATTPRIAQALEQIAAELKRSNELKARELEMIEGRSKQQVAPTREQVLRSQLDQF